MTDLTLDDVVAAMAAEDTEINSAVVFIVSVPALVAAAAASAGINQTKAAALIADMQSQTTAITNALVAGTPTAAASSPTGSGTTAVAASAVASMKKKLGL